MKRAILTTAFLLLLSSVSSAADTDWRVQPVFAVNGIYGATKTYTMTSDTAVTLQVAYVAGGGTWVSNGLNPIGFLVVCETNAGRLALGGGTPTVDNVGIPISALGSAQFVALGVADGTKITNSAAGSNAKYHITPIYQK